MSIITKSKPASKQRDSGPQKPAPMVVYNAQILAGPELDYIRRGRLEISGKLITSVSEMSGDENDLPPDDGAFDGRGLLIIPAFVNAHTHVGDSIGKDIGASLGLDERVNPVFGIKKRILETTPPSQLRSFMHYSAISMLTKGIVNFADFREGGIDGVLLLKDALDGLPIKPLILARSERNYDRPQAAEKQNESAGRDADGTTEVHAQSGAGNERKSDTATIDSEITELLDKSDGLGISGANEHSDSALSRYRSLVRQQAEKRLNSSQGKRAKPLVAVHAAESRETVDSSIARTGRSEVERILSSLEPDVMVHMTHASERELDEVASRGIGIVVCPRANGVLGVGIPPVSLMLEAGCTVALGTDNVMLNSPDMFREMDYIWKASRAESSRAARKEMLSPRQVLKMATVNGGKVLGLNTGCIAPGMSADLLFIDCNHIDLAPMHDPYAAIVQRAGPDCIKAVMASGEFVELVP